MKLEILKFKKLLKNVCKNALKNFIQCQPPPFALGEGGLVRHTLAACCWAKDLLQLEQYSILLPKADYILAALILHDSVKKVLENQNILFSNILFMQRNL